MPSLLLRSIGIGNRRKIGERFGVRESVSRTITEEGFLEMTSGGRQDQEQG